MAVGVVPAPSNQFVVVLAKAYKPLYDENDRLVISNVPALRKGFDAYRKQEASDNDRAIVLWAEAEDILKREREKETAPSAQGQVQMEDDFGMACVGEVW